MSTCAEGHLTADTLGIAEDASEQELPVGTCEKGALLVLVCGVPGCGKDAIGRACVHEFPSGVAVSQDEHGGDAARLHRAFQALLHARRSPILLLRNGIDAADRSPYIHAARRHGYTVAAVWPSELSCGEITRKAAMYLAAVSGCYGRLCAGGCKGHETLTVADDMSLPARACLSFLNGFRAPSVPGEVDHICAIRFLKTNAEINPESGDRLFDGFVSPVANHMKSSKKLPGLVSSCLTGVLEDVQAQLSPCVALRRDVASIAGEMSQWLSSLLVECDLASARPCSCPAVAPNKEEIKRLQREVKIRGAIEHLISPSNIAGCRATGSTVKNCTWISVEGKIGLRPAWPPSHFCGAPQLKKLGANADEVLDAVRTSASATAPLQHGDDGMLVQIVPQQLPDVLQGTVLITPIMDLPPACLHKLGRPEPSS